MKQSARTFAATFAGACLAVASATAGAGEVQYIVKKTLDGRCLAPGHPEYWDTKIYVKKPSMKACVASGGKEAKA